MSDPFKSEARLSPELRARILERGRARVRRRRILTTGGVAIAAIAVAVPLVWVPGAGRTSHVNTGTVPATERTATTVPPTIKPGHRRRTPAPTAPPGPTAPTATSLPSVGNPSPSPTVTAPSPSPSTVLGPPSRSGACPATDLHASFLGWSSRTATGVWRLGLTNDATTACTLAGYPGVALDLMGRGVVTVTATDVADPLDGAGARSILLGPGASAHFSLTMLESGNDCPQLLGFQIQLPQAGSLTLNTAGMHFYCGALHITPPRAGSG